MKKITKEVTEDICCLCKNDPQVFCPRNVDAKCLICGQNFCGAHIGEHLQKEHCVSINLDYCGYLGVEKID